MEHQKKVRWAFTISLLIGYSHAIADTLWLSVNDPARIAEIEAKIQPARVFQTATEQYIIRGHVLGYRDNPKLATMTQPAENADAAQHAEYLAAVRNPLIKFRAWWRASPEDDIVWAVEPLLIFKSQIRLVEMEKDSNFDFVLMFSDAHLPGEVGTESWRKDFFTTVVPRGEWELGDGSGAKLEPRDPRYPGHILQYFSGARTASPQLDGRPTPERMLRLAADMQVGNPFGVQSMSSLGWTELLHGLEVNDALYGDKSFERQAIGVFGAACELGNDLAAHQKKVWLELEPLRKKIRELKREDPPDEAAIARAEAELKDEKQRVRAELAPIQPHLDFGQTAKNHLQAALGRYDGGARTNLDWTARHNSALRAGLGQVEDDAVREQMLFREHLCRLTVSAPEPKLPSPARHFVQATDTRYWALRTLNEQDACWGDKKELPTVFGRVVAAADARRDLHEMGALPDMFLSDRRQMGEAALDANMIQPADLEWTPVQALARDTLIEAITEGALSEIEDHKVRIESPRQMFTDGLLQGQPIYTRIWLHSGRDPRMLSARVIQRARSPSSGDGWIHCDYLDQSMPMREKQIREQVTALVVLSAPYEHAAGSSEISIQVSRLVDKALTNQALLDYLMALGGSQRLDVPKDLERTELESMRVAARSALDEAVAVYQAASSDPDAAYRALQQHLEQVPLPSYANKAWLDHYCPIFQNKRVSRFGGSAYRPLADDYLVQRPTPEEARCWCVPGARRSDECQRLKEQRDEQVR